MQKQTIRDVDWSGKRALVCVDFNVPLENGRITDDTRIRAAVPTIQHLLDHGAVQALKPGDVLMLQNTRFDAREEANDEGMARQLALLGNVFVNDAFGAAHRAHASTEGVAHFLPAVSGFLMEKELAPLGSMAIDRRCGHVRQAVSWQPSVCQWYK